MRIDFSHSMCLAELIEQTYTYLTVHCQKLDDLMRMRCYKKMHTYVDNRIAVIDRVLLFANFTPFYSVHLCIFSTYLQRNHVCEVD